MIFRRFSSVLLCLLPFSGLQAGTTDIQYVEFEKRGQAWSVRVRLQHADEGWQHYADAWRIVTESGQLVGKRILMHPHVDEQPFTRGLNDVRIPDNIRIVYVEARDSKHGWARERIRVDLYQPNGLRFRVKGR